jgi:hypothetical protein
VLLFPPAIAAFVFIERHSVSDHEQSSGLGSRWNYGNIRHRRDFGCDCSAVASLVCQSSGRIRAVEGRREEATPVFLSIPVKQDQRQFIY